MSNGQLTSWVDVCPIEDLLVDRGVCALAHGQQIAIFRVSPSDELYAVSNFDPIGKAFVMSRGIVGSRGDVPKVASPLYKQSFDLRTGECLEDPTVRLPTYSVELVDGVVRVAVPAENDR